MYTIETKVNRYNGTSKRYVAVIRDAQGNRVATFTDYSTGLALARATTWLALHKGTTPYAIDEQLTESQVWG